MPKPPGVDNPPQFSLERGRDEVARWRSYGYSTEEIVVALMQAPFNVMCSLDDTALLIAEVESEAI